MEKKTFHFKFSDDWENYPLSCGCGWKGKLNDDEVGIYEALMDFSCPDCNNILAIISSSGGEGLPDAIRPFKSKQNPDQMSALEKSFIDARETFLNEFDQESLKSPDQLPDLDGDRFEFVWDSNHVEGKTVILFRKKIIWSEPKVWEGYDRFIEVVEILKNKYGEKLIDLIPTEDSYLYLLGDSYSAYDQIEEVRRKISK